MAEVINANERRCKAETKRGRCRVERGLNAEGLCSMHSGRTDPRELGRLSGKRRREPDPERVHEGLRVFLQREVPPERVWQALEAAMLGSNEAARVSASKVLIDALSEGRDGDGCPRCAEAAAEREANSDKARASVTGLVVDAVVQIIEADPHPVGLARMAADLLDERQRRRIADLHGLKLDQIRSASADAMVQEALAGA